MSNEKKNQETPNPSHKEKIEKSHPSGPLHESKLPDFEFTPPPPPPPPPSQKKD